MKLKDLVLQTRERLAELEIYREKLITGRIRGSLSLTAHSIEINQLLMKRLFELYVYSCKMKGKQIPNSYEVFSEQ
jgi:hypothetical protein